ncbi:MAG: hypothetical protein GY851_35405 [bacterium]|nr:hypothetical protein [bacterium]
MCEPASFVLTKDRAFWSMNHDNHHEIIAEHKLCEDGARGPNVVRVEITPPAGDMRKPIADWVFRVDQDLLPDWWDEVTGEKRARQALVDWHAARVFLTGRHKLSEGSCWLYNNASAVLCDNASAVLCDNASAVLCDNASAVLCDNASARLYNNASADLCDNASARLCDNASARLYNNASARLCDNASAVLCDNASAVLCDNASARLCDNASARLCDNASARLYNNATATKHSGSPTVTLNTGSNAVAIDRTGDRPKCRVAQAKQ